MMPVYRPPSIRSRVLAAGLRVTARPVADRDGRHGLPNLAFTRRLLDVAGSAGVRMPACRCLMGGVPAEVVAGCGGDQTKAVLYLHGGGFVMGSPRSHRGLAARLSRHARCPVWLPHYRLAPEHPFPAAFDDALAAYTWLVTEGGIAPDDVVIAGESAGAQLAAAVTAALGPAGLPLPGGLVLLSPWLDLDPVRMAAANRTLRDPFSSVPYAAACLRAYVGDADSTDPRLDVLGNPVDGFPPVLIQVGGTEVLTVGAQRMTAALTAAGVPVELQVWPGQVHAWPAFAPVLPEAGQALRAIARFVRRRQLEAPVVDSSLVA